MAVERPDRANTKTVSAQLPADMYWQLKILAVERKTDLQVILAEAVNGLFKKYNKPTVSFKIPE